MLQLQLFSLQILHHKNTFLAKGFTVDTALLTTESDHLFILIIKISIIYIYRLMFR